MFSSNTSQVSADANWIEECFSTHLYTGNGSTQTITNGIDLSTKGGLVWIKNRISGVSHGLYDTNRGAYKWLASDRTDAETTQLQHLTAFNNNGFSLGSSSIVNGTVGGSTYASWTFRKQPKFFDVVTYTGNGSNPRNIAHSLGSAPGCVIIKRTDSTGDWGVWHRGSGATNGAITNFSLNTTDAAQWTSEPQTTMTSTTFQASAVRSYGAASGMNVNGAQYVAYLFAHDAGGFGLTGTDNVISCGSWTATGNDTINLGYEPQWLLLRSTGVDDWQLFDTMRGLTVTTSASKPVLYPNSSLQEDSLAGIGITSTGFTSTKFSGTYIYIAIRRGPMKTPTTGTSVFAPTTWTGTGAALQQNVGINYDSFMQWRRNGGYSTPWMDKLRGFGLSIYTQSTNAEVNQTAYIAGPKQNNYINFVDGTYNLNGEPWLNYAFVRAPGFFDVVCYTGTGVNRTVTHNLGVAPELMIIKARSSGSYGWPVYAAAPGPTQFAYLDDTSSFSANSTAWNDTAPTASVFTVGTGSLMNTSSVTYVAYLFATVSGVSKVGSYTGTGTTKQIDCGFTGGARFVLIKRTDDTGDWYVWDSARGIVSGNDPYLRLNSTAAEVTNTDYIDTYSAGFEISSTAPAAINANGGSFIFLAIA